MNGFQYLFIIISISIGSVALAGNVSVPNEFKAGDKAVAADVNANFSAVAQEVNDNDSRIVNNNDRIAVLEKTIKALQEQLATLQANTVLQLDGKLSLDTSSGYETALFSGINVQVNNGIDHEHLNGLGNLIIGYNEDRPASGEKVCSDGQYQLQASCESNGGVWAYSHKSGSHNLVVGPGNSYSQDSGVVFGFYNVINRHGAVITAGNDNIASGLNSSISGGRDNTVLADSSSISGGENNTASGNGSSISGGFVNTARGDGSSICGGSYNTASSYASSVTGGYGNYAGGIRSSVSGGNSRTALGEDNWRAGSLFEEN